MDYKAHDFWIKERHDFVRRLHRPEALYGPYNAPGARTVDRWVFWSCVAVVAFLAILKYGFGVNI